MGMYKLLIRYNQGKKIKEVAQAAIDIADSGLGQIMARTRCRRRGFEHWGGDHPHPAPTGT